METEVWYDGRLIHVICGPEGFAWALDYYMLRDHTMKGWYDIIVYFPRKRRGKHMSRTKEDALLIQEHLKETGIIVPDRFAILLWEEFCNEDYCAGWLDPKTGPGERFRQWIKEYTAEPWT